MKLTILLLCLPLFAASQKIVEDRQDEFKNFHVKRTNWEKQVEKMSGPVSFIRISKIDTVTCIDFRTALAPGNVFSVSKGAEFILKLADNSIVTLKAFESVVSSKGGGSIGMAASTWYGAEIRFIPTKEQIEQLKNSPVIKYRLYTNDGYDEQDVREKYQNSLSKLLLLF